MNPFHRALHDYLATVAGALGIGMESCALDVDAPVSAYLAVDHKVAAYPDRDVAVLWDERRGWSVAMETHSGEDLILLAELGNELAELGNETIRPPADVVARFVVKVCAAKNDGSLAGVA